MISYQWPLWGSNFPPCRCEACPVKTFASGYLGRWLVVAPGLGKIWLNDLGIITCLRRNSFSQFIGTPPEKWTYPLRIDGWKMTFPFKMVPFQGTSSFSRGVYNYKLYFMSLNFQTFIWQATAFWVTNFVRRKGKPHFTVHCLSQGQPPQLVRIVSQDKPALRHLDAVRFQLWLSMPMKLHQVRRLRFNYSTSSAALPKLADRAGA